MSSFSIKKIYFLFSLLSGLILLSCSENSEIIEEDGDWKGNAIQVRARLASGIYTRGYQEEGDVSNGTYYLSYPQISDQKYVVGNVLFGTTPQEKIGIAKSVSGTELRWTDVGGSPTTFALDNVPPSMNQNDSEPSIVYFDEDNNPFKASVFDDSNGSNDLLWGTSTVTRDTRSIGFDLHHNMSRVIVQVKVAHIDVKEEEIDLTGATVKITNLYTEPETYNRLDGNLYFGEKERGDVIIVSPGGSSDWESSKVIENDTTVYYSRDIVLPPQSLLEDVNRPKLEITLQNGDVYTGILPHAMLIANSASQSDALTYPVNLAFLKEYILTIRTVITENPPELAFMPVYVVEWVDKGEFDLEAHQAGIYLANEFYNLIGYYEKNNEYQLVRYGYLETPEGSDQEQWIFQFFSSVTLDYDKIYNKMHPGTQVDGSVAKDFSFYYNNYSVDVIKDGDLENAKSVNPGQLKQIVKGSLQWDNF